MTWPAIHRIRLAQKTRRCGALRLFAVVVALIALLPVAQPAHAHADTICTLTATGPTCPSYPPPALLDLNQALYAATPAQAASLQVLETQAITQVLTLHGLAPADAGAVQSWGRADAEGELFALLLQALNTGATARTPDQQNAVAWLATVDQRQAIAAAQAAGLEYVKWAGLDQGSYQVLLNSHAGESDLQSFLSGTPNADAFCNYHSPAPYASDYTAYPPSTNPADCITAYTNPFSFLTSPPTPSYDQFVKWGEADANYPWLNAPDFGKAAQAEAAGLGVGIPLAAATFAAPLGSEVAAQIASAAALDVIDGVLVGAGGGSAAAGAGGAAAVAVAEGVAEGVGISVSAEGTGSLVVVLLALTAAVIEGITVVNAAKLPGQLATLISGAEATPLDPAALESTSNGLGLYGLFVGATLPVPANRTCDNAAYPAGSATLVAGGVTSITFNVPCLNATDIPAASATDPTFLVQAKDATTQSASPTITWKDAAAGTTTTARLSETWFIEQANGATVQTLRLAYTDWAGAERTAWLLGNPTDGYNFVTLAASSTAVDPSTCVANGTCSFSPSIDYVGPDGQDYTASVRAYTPPTGSPSYSTAVEGSPVTFDAHGYAPGGATAPLTYTWQFQQAGCGMPCYSVDPVGPAYTAPVAGATATYTWPTAGSYLVSLTATDAHGAQANDTFTVHVGDMPPTLALYPDCATLAGPIFIFCNARTVNVGSPVTLAGSVGHAGSLDNERVTVNWGDGSFEDTAGGGPNSGNVAGNPLTVTSTGDGTPYGWSDAHTYAQPGVYTGTVWVADWFGGTASQTFVETVLGRPQAIAFPAIAQHTYGDAPFAIAATGGASDNPVTFAVVGVPGACALSSAGGSSGAGSATVTLLGAGDCRIAASQAGGGPYDAAPSVERDFFVEEAPLTVTASSPSMTYGGATPAITPTYSGFVNGDTVASVTTPATCKASTPGANPYVGTYQTTCTGMYAPNYHISAYVPGALTVAPAPLTITADDKTMTYGGATPRFTATDSGLVNRDGPLAVLCGATDAAGQPVGGGTPAGRYPITCGGSQGPEAANYAISYKAGTLTIAPAPQAIAITSTPPSPAYVGTTYTVAASGGASGNPVTVTAGPSSVCASGGTNGAAIALVGVGTCTLTANQAGTANYSAAAAVTQSVAVVYPPLALGAGMSSSPAGPITTGSVVTVTGTLANHTAAAEKVTLKATLTYVSPSGQRVTISGSSRAVTLAAGQTLGQPVSFTIGKSFPRGTYTIALTATDTAGDTASGSASLTVV